MHIATQISKAQIYASGTPILLKKNNQNNVAFNLKQTCIIKERRHVKKHSNRYKATDFMEAQEKSTQCKESHLKVRAKFTSLFARK